MWSAIKYFTKSKLLLFVSVFLSVNIFCQEYNYVHYDVKDGLAGSTVYGVVQDKDGFMWYGTETGLSRFDGTHFKNFYTSDGLPDNEIIKLFVDSKNRVWIVPFKNSICYYWKGKIHNQENDSVLRQISISAEIISVNEDPFGNILVSELHHLYLINTKQTVVSILPSENIPFSVIKVGLDKVGRFKIAVMAKGFLEFSNIDLVNFKLMLNDQLIHTAPKTHPNSFSSVEISPNLEMYSLNNNFHIISTKDNTESDIKIPNGFIAFSRLNDSLLTLNSTYGTYLYDVKEKSIVDTFMVGSVINSVTKDSENNLWFCVPGKGVYRTPSEKVINYFFAEQNKPVFCIHRFDSLLYIGSENYQLMVFDFATKKVKEWQISNKGTRGRITAFYKTTGDTVIIGTDIGLFAMDLRTNKIIDDNQFAGSIKSISGGSNNSFIVSANRAVLRMDARNFSFRDSIWRERATCSWEDNDNVYVGTLNGLYVVNGQKKISYLGENDTVFRSRINAMSKGEDGTVWIATNGSGLVAVKNDKVVFNITEANGLTSNICRNVFTSPNALWVGTDKGVNKISRLDTGFSITSFTDADGLNSNIINAVYADGQQIYVGTPMGIAYFNEAQISKKSICNLRLTSISTLANIFSNDTINFSLDHADNNIEFQYVGISFKSAGKIVYKYRLLGLDTNWRTTNATSVNYQSLSSGNYEFQLTATNKFGVQGNMVSVPFDVSKTIWEKTWVRLLLFIAALALFWVLINYRINIIRKKEKEKSETASKISELEQMALKSQMNPHFIFNCLNSIQDYVLEKDIFGANEFIADFSKLIRLTLDHSSKQFISISEEINYLSSYLGLEQKRFEDKFTFEINADGVPKNNYFIPPMILQPYVENAIRHGVRYREDNGGKVKIKFEKKEGYLVASIYDNGIGRKRSQELKGKNTIEYQSKGMDLTAKRIEMFNKVHDSKIVTEILDLEDESKIGVGTEVQIKFPVKEIEKPNKI